MLSTVQALSLSRLLGLSPQTEQSAAQSRARHQASGLCDEPAISQSLTSTCRLIPVDYVPRSAREPQEGAAENHIARSAFVLKAGYLNGRSSLPLCFIPAQKNAACPSRQCVILHLRSISLCAPPSQSLVFLFPCS